MSRSKHTRPRRLRAADRTRAPHEPRSSGDPSTQHRQALALKEQGLCPQPDATGAELPNPAPLPRLLVQRPRPGHLHPAGRADLEQVLRFFGPAHFYGLRSVCLRRTPARPNKRLLGRLVVPGQVFLYEQPAPPWRLTSPLAPGEEERLVQAGAAIEPTNADTCWLVHWPGATLRDFMLWDVFLHEVGHHVLQHETGKRTARVVRTRDHEAFADLFARRCRLAFLAASAERGPSS
jgi:hypothetical protein